MSEEKISDCLLSITPQHLLLIVNFIKRRYFRYSEFPTKNKQGEVA